MAADTGWSDYRVEILKKLWAEGILSATEIAYRLDVTRNAVLGKINRLGLAREPLTDAQKDMRRSQRHPRATAQVAQTTGRPASPELIDPTSPIPGTDGRPGFLGGIEQLSEDVWELLDERLASRRIGVLELSEHMCRWPIGDPKDQGFHFCGCRKAPDTSYCHRHVREAYQRSGRKRAA